MTGRTLICNGFADDNRGGASLTIATIEALRAAGSTTVDLLTLADPRTSYPCTTRWDGGVRLRDRHDLGLRTSRARVVISFLLALLPARLVSSGVRRRIISRLGRFLMPGVDTHAAIILKPGYVLVSRTTPGSLASLVTTTTPLIAAWANGVPTVGVGHSVVISDHGGKRWERLSSLYVTQLLRKMTAIAVRDDRSYDDAVAATEGAGTEVCLFPDVALMFPWAEAPDTMDRTADGTIRVGIAAGHGAPGPTADQLAAAVHRLVPDQPVEVAIIQQSTDPRDIDRAEAIRQHLVRGGTMARTFRPPPEMLESIGLWKGVDMAIAARMHAALFCVIVGTPVRLLDGDPRKARQVLHAADLDRVMVRDIDDIAAPFDDENYDDEVGAARAAWPEFIAWLTVQLDPHPTGRRR